MIELQSKNKLKSLYKISNNYHGYLKSYILLSKGLKLPEHLRKLLNSPMMSTTLTIFSISSGHTSGQCVNPKYIRIHLPLKSELLHS